MMTNTEIQALLENADAATLEKIKDTVDYRLRDVLITQAAVLTAMSFPHTDTKSVQEVVYVNGAFESYDREVRPIPDDDGFFENVWRGYRDNKNVF